MSLLSNLVYGIGMSAVAVSAMTGVLEAGSRRMDMFGVGGVEIPLNTPARLNPRLRSARGAGYCPGWR